MAKETSDTISGQDAEIPEVKIETMDQALTRLTAAEEEAKKILDETLENKDKEDGKEQYEAAQAIYKVAQLQLGEVAAKIAETEEKRAAISRSIAAAQATPMGVGPQSQRQEAQDVASDSISFDQPQSPISRNQAQTDIKPTRGITEAIREEVLEKQRQLFKVALENEEIDDGAGAKKKIGGMTFDQFKEFLDRMDDKGKDALLDRAITKDHGLEGQLRNIETEGYKKVHEEFKDQLKDVQWDGPRADKIRSQEVKAPDGRVVATLTETTKTENGVTFRTIDFPKQLDGKGPMHASMAVKDENGNNIAADKALYFTAHYNEAGKLEEVSSPQPVKFMGEGRDAVGYIEKDGKRYTLPVTRGKYQEMMMEVAKNKGIERAPIQQAQDIVIGPEQAQGVGRIQSEDRDLRTQREGVVGQSQAQGAVRSGVDVGTQTDPIPSVANLSNRAEREVLVLEEARQAARAEELAKIEGRIAEVSSKLSEEQRSEKGVLQRAKDVKIKSSYDRLLEGNINQTKLLQATGAVKLEIAEKMTERTLSTAKETMPEEAERLKKASKGITEAKETFESKVQDAIAAQEKLKEAQEKLKEAQEKLKEDKKEPVTRLSTDDEIKTLAGAEGAVKSSIEALQNAELGVNDSVRAVKSSIEALQNAGKALQSAELGVNDSVRAVAQAVPRDVADKVQKEYGIEGLIADTEGKVSELEKGFEAMSLVMAKNLVTMEDNAKTFGARSLTLAKDLVNRQDTPTKELPASTVFTPEQDKISEQAKIDVSSPVKRSGPVTEKDLNNARETLRGLEVELKRTEGRVNQLLEKAEELQKESLKESVIIAKKEIELARKDSDLYPLNDVKKEKLKKAEERLTKAEKELKGGDSKKPEEKSNPLESLFKAKVGENTPGLDALLKAVEKDKSGKERKPEETTQVADPKSQGQVLGGGAEVEAAARATAVAQSGDVTKAVKLVEVQAQKADTALASAPAEGKPSATSEASKIREALITPPPAKAFGAGQRGGQKDKAKGAQAQGQPVKKVDSQGATKDEQKRAQQRQPVHQNRGNHGPR